MFHLVFAQINAYQRGLVFRDGVIRQVLTEGRHWLFSWKQRIRVEVVSMRTPWLKHADLDMIARSDLLADELTVIELKDHERALVWIDGRFAKILEPGLHALFSTIKRVEYEVCDTSQVRFEHPQRNAIEQIDAQKRHCLRQETINHGFQGLLFVDGMLREVLPCGRYAFWRQPAEVRILHVDMRENMLDVSGQEIMTADKVTLRVNATLTFKVSDPQLAASAADDYQQALYRDAQLALRAVIGTRELDSLLGDKDLVAQQLLDALHTRAAELGLRVVALGIRDIILPGEMKELLNKVTEAKKAAEAAVITRREETAAMRSQANTAKLLESNSTLMRLKELEVLQAIAEKSQLQVILGEKGLSERVINLL